MKSSQCGRVLLFPIIQTCVGFCHCYKLKVRFNPSLTIFFFEHLDCFFIREKTTKMKLNLTFIQLMVKKCILEIEKNKNSQVKIYM